MNLYEKVTAFLKLNKVREKDIVMAYGYTPEKILIITPYLLKNSFSEYDYDDIDFDNMANFIVFGLDYITQKAWILAILGDVTTWKFKKDIRYCKEFYINNVTQKLLKDKKTMAFNKINGGTVDFNEKIWKSWYQLWMNDTKHYYAYVYDDEIKKYIGEVSYYFEEEYREYVLNIIIEYPYRHLGKGKVALELLCKQAKESGLRFLCDDIETNNPAKNLFLDIGFKEVWARENITMLKKRL